MKKKWITAILVVVMIAAMSLNSLAYSQQEKTADALNELGLFRGKGTAGYDLEANLTRAEGATLLVRVLGKDAEARYWSAPIPFNDVPLWAIGYVGYAYENGITNGTNMEKGEFSPNADLSDFMFLTLVLRALGYSDQGASPQFVWNDPYALAAEIGLIDEAQPDSDFTRGDAVEILWNAMGVRMIGRDTTLAESLIIQGIFTEEEFLAADEIQQNGRTENAGKPAERLEDTEEIYPWELSGAKQPSDYTWDEFEALTGNQQLAFQSAIGGYEAFDAWMIQVGGDVGSSNNTGSGSSGNNNIGNGNTGSGNTGNNNTETEDDTKCPWDEPGAKQPKDYTWAEFEALTGNQQLAFQSAIGGYEAFDVWMNRVQDGYIETYPWELSGAKQPKDYTWAEFEALTGNQQLAFQSAIGGYEAFDVWMNRVIR